MGGKKNQAQRTKNNAKPSSSARSADLLGKDASKLVGFISLKHNVFAGKSQLLAADDLETIDPNFHVSLKKLSKKDAITKQKGLQELREKFQSTEANQSESLKSLITLWSQVYPTLALDIDNKVREHTQLAHKALTTCVGRQIAPILKQIAPVWYASQYDTYPPAASVASASLKATFPDTKLKDLICFCHSEIFTFIFDNLIHQTPQSLSKPDVSAEDQEARYERVVISSLNAYSQYIEILSSHSGELTHQLTQEKVCEENKKLISSSKYWSLSSQSNPLMRAAWYSSLISLCKNRPDLVKDEAKHLVKSVFSKLDEQDALVVSLVWEAALYSLQIINENNPEMKANIDKVVFNQLCSVLMKGGFGNASVIYPSILPLVSCIGPSQVNSLDQKSMDFYHSFFTSLRSGLKEHNVRLSHSETEVIINTYMECLRYVIMKYNQSQQEITGDNISAEQFTLQIVDKQLVELLDEVVKDPLYRSAVRRLYHCIGDLVIYWQKCASSQPGTTYLLCLETLWNSIKESFLKTLESSATEPSLATHVLYCQRIFCETFLTPSTLRNKKNLKVKFDSKDDDSSEEAIIDETMKKLSLDSNTELKLNQLGSELIKAYYGYIQSGENVSQSFKHSCLSQLSKLVRLFGFNIFLDSCCLVSDKLCEILDTWLCDDDIPAEPVLVLTFTALASITEEQLRKTLLLKLTETRPEMLIEEAVKICMTGKRENKLINDWLQGSLIKTVLISCVDKACDSDNYDEKSLRVLRLALISTTPSAEYVVGDKTVALLLEKLCNKFENEGINPRALTLVEHTFKSDTISFFKNHYKSVFTVIKTFLSKCLNGSEQISSYLNIVKEAIICCLNTFDSSSKEIRSLISDYALLICQFFEQRSHNTIGTVGCENVVNVTYNFISYLVKGSNDHNVSKNALQISLNFLTDILKLNKTKWEQNIEKICNCALYIHGESDSEPYQSNTYNKIEGVWNPLYSIDAASYSRIILISIKLIFSLTGERESSQECIDDDILLSNDELINFDSLIIQYTYSLNLLRSFSQYYSSSKEYLMCHDVIERLSPSLKELVQRLDSAQFLSNLSTQVMKFSEGSTCDTLNSRIVSTIKLEFLESEVEDSDIGNKGERILTSNLEVESLRALRNKLKSKTKSLESFISFICWKFETDKAQATSLYKVSLRSVGSLQLNLSIELARFLSELIKYNDAILEKKTWDFIINSLAAWTQSILKTQPLNYNDAQIVGFITGVCDLYITFHKYIYSNAESTDVSKQERNKYISKSWDIFKSDIESAIFNVWKVFAHECSEYIMEPINLLLIERLSDAVQCIMSQGGTSLLRKDEAIVSIVKTCSPLLLSHCPSIQITSFLTLISVAGDVSRLDSGLDDNHLTSGNNISSLYLKDILIKTQTVVEAMLLDFKLGVMCLVDELTESYAYTRGYLMVWLVFLEMFTSADSRVRHLYTACFKEERILNKLMDSLLHLLPNVVVYPSESNAKKIQASFSIPPTYSYDGWTSSRLAKLSSWVYVHVLRVLPLLSRLWYSESDPKTRDFTDKFTSLYVSPLLINEEINSALQETKKCENLTLESLPTARMVNAVFAVEESKILLVVHMASNHPLVPPRVDISKSVVSSSQTKNKLKQLTLFPTLQNGTLWDCIIVWKNYLDKKFEGVEECYICYSVLHYGTNQLPKLTCRTCKKRFHSACLYKWFTSSNKSTCPICRNLF